MKLGIILTPKAKDTFLATILIIKFKWGDKSAEKFVERTYAVLDTIAQQPYLFKAYQGNDVRKGLITKHTSVVYRVVRDRIEVLFSGTTGKTPLFKSVRFVNFSKNAIKQHTPCLG